jgi:hypothetical protein
LRVPIQQIKDLALAAYDLKALEADLLRHVSQNLFPTLISSYAHPGFRQQGTLLSTSSETRPLMDALLALSSLHVSNRSTYYDERAVRYYSKSMHDLRKQVGDRVLRGTEDHLLMNVVWLYIFEVSSNRSPADIARLKLTFTDMGHAAQSLCRCWCPSQRRPSDPEATAKLAFQERPSLHHSN